MKNKIAFKIILVTLVWLGMTALFAIGLMLGTLYIFNNPLVAVFVDLAVVLLVAWLGCKFVEREDD